MNRLGIGAAPRRARFGWSLLAAGLIERTIDTFTTTDALVRIAASLVVGLWIPFALARLAAHKRASLLREITGRSHLAHAAIALGACAALAGASPFAHAASGAALALALVALCVDLLRPADGELSDLDAASAGLPRTIARRADEVPASYRAPYALAVAPLPVAERRALRTRARRATIAACATTAATVTLHALLVAPSPAPSVASGTRSLLAFDDACDHGDAPACRAVAAYLDKQGIHTRATERYARACELGDERSCPD
jgi:hypothetical protein